MKKLFILILILLVTSTTTGCWDRRDIEKRGYVMGIALDSYADIKNKVKPIEESLPYTGNKKYFFTVQLPIWKKGQLLKTGGGGGGGGENESSTWEQSVAGNSLMEMNREISTRNNYPPFYELMDVLVLSKKVASENGISSWIDLLLRDPEMRVTLRVFVSEGMAKDTLAIIPKIDSYSTFYLAGISQNALSKTAHILFNVNIGQLSEYRYADLDYAIPLIFHSKSEFKDTGAAVFKKNKMVGELNEIETEALNILENKYKAGVITVPCQQHKDEIIGYEVVAEHTKIKSLLTQNQVKFDIHAGFRGAIAEVGCYDKHDVSSEEFQNMVRKQINAKIKQNIESTLKKLQSIHSDAARFIMILQKDDYDFWKTNKKNWREDIFPQASFDVKVDTKIIHTGITK